MGKKGVLFDLDGVLIDTEGTYTQFWKDMGEQYPTGIDNFAQQIKGMNLRSILDTYFPDKVLQAKLIKDIDYFEENMQYRIFPGVIEFLEDLVRADIPSCIVTSSSKSKTEQLFAQIPNFRKYFQGIVTGDMVAHSKPHPECFLVGANLIGCEPKDCYVFEDSQFGIQAGLNSGCKVVALTTTVSRDFIDKKADEIIDNFIGYTVIRMLDI